MRILHRQPFGRRYGQQRVVSADENGRHDANSHGIVAYPQGARKLHGVVGAQWMGKTTISGRIHDRPIDRHNVVSTARVASE